MKIIIYFSILFALSSCSNIDQKSRFKSKNGREIQYDHSNNILKYNNYAYKLADCSNLTFHCSKNQFISVAYPKKCNNKIRFEFEDSFKFINNIDIYLPNVHKLKFSGIHGSTVKKRFAFEYDGKKISSIFFSDDEQVDFSKILQSEDYSYNDMDSYRFDFVPTSRVMGCN